MSARLDYYKLVPGGIKPLLALHHYLEGCGLEKNLIHMVFLRASLVNGCAYCIDMHWKDLRAMGETEERLYMLSAWRESPSYSEREKAAFVWTEAVTRIADEGASDEAYRIARERFSETELANLTLAIVAINGWNRLAIAFRAEPGKYQPRAA